MSSDDVPPSILDRLRALCGVLPEVVEEPAWTGMRWRVRGKTFAHVLLVADGWPPIYASTLGHDGPAVVVTFQTSEVAYFANADPAMGVHHFGFGRDTVGATVHDRSDWEQIREWLTESYCLLAPKKLAAQVANAR